MVWTSLFGILTVVMLARALGFAKAPLLTDADAARAIARDALHDFTPTEAIIADDRRNALVAGHDGRVALVRPLGDRWVVRIVNGAKTTLVRGRLRLMPAEAMFAPVDLALGNAAARWAAKL